MVETPAAALQIDRTVLEAAGARLGLSMLVLFGSHATGAPPPGPDSDVDLALGFRRDSRPTGARVWDCHEALRDAFPGAALDVVFLAAADPLFRWEIMRHGRLLWGDPIEHLEYRAFAFRDFVDSADLRALERRLFDRKMALVHERLRAAS